jgi:hypothetical protein
LLTKNSVEGNKITKTKNH